VPACHPSPSCSFALPTSPDRSLWVAMRERRRRIRERRRR
jgi:hypothetical protein